MRSLNKFGFRAIEDLWRMHDLFGNGSQSGGFSSSIALKLPRFHEPQGRLYICLRGIPPSIADQKPYDGNQLDDHTLYDR